MRQQAVKAVKNGQTAASVATAMGVNIRTVFRWLSDFATGGQNALLAKKITGRPPLVTPDEMRWIAETVRDKTPWQMRLEFGLWTLSLIGEVIYRQFGKRLTSPSVGRIMRLLGFTPQIADEAGVRSDFHAGTTWAPVGRPPTVKTTGRRYGLNLISAVSARGDFRFMVQEGNVTAEVFIEFLKRLLRGAEQPIILVVDGHPIHKAKSVKTFVEQQQGRLQLVFLPPYAPQLNPDEQVWGYIKPRVAKQMPENKIELKKLVQSAMHRLQKLPDVVKSFFRHPECQYAGE
jgi:transposase